MIISLIIKIVLTNWKNCKIVSHFKYFCIGWITINDNLRTRILKNQNKLNKNES